MLTRRSLLKAAPLSAFAASPSFAAGDDKPTAPQRTAADELYPSHDPALAREIVGASHAKLDRVRELLTDHPALAVAAWDWGFGDWESALGAASHTGQREIAALLIEHGARPDIFTFAMLGQLDALRAIVSANPGIQRLNGPHGLSLLKHAEAGGEKSQAVVEYLKGLGDAGLGQPSNPVPADWTERYAGEFTYGPRPEDRFSVALRRNGDLTIRRGDDGTPRRLCYQSDHRFSPCGAARVVIRFEARDATVSGLEIIDGPKRVAATRIMQ